MESNNTPVNQSSTLREKATQKFERMEQKSEEGRGESVDKLLNELRVHQIELEMQNEDLRQAQLELEESRNKYFDLYDLAPVGYLTLDQGLINNANLAVADLLGCNRKVLIKQRFSRFVAPDSQDRYYLYCNQIAQGMTPPACELKLITMDERDLYVQITGLPLTERATTGQQLRLAITNITRLKLAEKEAHDYQIKLKNLTSKLTLAEEHLKNHIATQLHDQISQSLAMLRVSLGRLAKSSPDPEQAEILKNAYNQLGMVLQEARDLTGELSFPALKLFGLKALTQKWAIQEVQEAHGIEVLLSDDGHTVSLDQDIQAVLFRGIRELLINVVKHAQANRVEIGFNTNKESMVVTIQDDGIGMDASRAGLDANLRGFGILSVTEALEGLGGSLTFCTSPGQGCAVTMVARLQG